MSRAVRSNINYMLLAIVVVIMQVVGALWYSPILFGRAWAANQGVTLEEISDITGTSPYVLSILGSILVCMVLNRLMVLTKTKDMLGGIRLAALLWLGLVLTSLSTHYAFLGMSRLVFIDAGKDLVAMAVAGAILASGQE